MNTIKSFRLVISYLLHLTMKQEVNIIYNDLRLKGVPHRDGVRLRTRIVSPDCVQYSFPSRRGKGRGTHLLIEDYVVGDRKNLLKSLLSPPLFPSPFFSLFEI